MSLQRIAFICSGNICRSPMAAVLAPPILEEASIDHRIISAGTLHIQGRKAASNAITAVAELGLELDSHRSQGASVPLLRFADHLVVMAPKHERYLLEADPQLAPKIVRMWEWADDPSMEMIPDPVGHDLEVFRGSRDLIKRCLQNWIAQL